MNTYDQELEAKLETARAKREENNKTAKLALLDNEAFINAKLEAQIKSEELTKLNTLMAQVSDIEPFVGKDGTKYGVRAYPINAFGLGFGALMGLIKGSDNAFTDEMLEMYSAITSISPIELREASQYMGSASYCNKAGVVVDGTPCNWVKFQPLLHSISLSLGLDAFDVSEVTEDKMDLWLSKEAIKATKEAATKEEADKLNIQSASFTLED